MKGMISYRLDMVVYLEDASTGDLIPSRNVEFRRDGRPQPAVNKEPGIFAFLNLDQDHFLMTVKASGYCEISFPVVCESRSNDIPLLHLSLVPGLDYPWQNQIHTISGTLKGIHTLEAIPWAGWQVRMRGYEKKTGTIRLFNPHGCLLNPVYYGVIHQEKKTFEKISVRKQISPEEIQIAGSLTEPWEENSPVERIIAGRVEGDRYLLQVRPDITAYLIRWSIKGKLYYRKLDMEQEAWTSLSRTGGTLWDR